MTGLKQDGADGNEMPAVELGEAPAQTPASLTTPGGCVEGLGPRYVWGWYNRKGKSLPVVEVTCGDEGYPVIPRWVARPELVAPGKPMAEKPGFQFGLPLEVMRKLVAQPDLIDTLAVTVDGVALPLAGDVTAIAPAPENWDHFPVEMRVMVAGRPMLAEAWIEGPFRLGLRFPDAVGAPATVDLICNGEPVQCVPLRLEEAAKDEKGVAASVLFEFELPGLVWEGLTAGGSLAFTFRGDETVFTAVPVTLTLEQAGEWLAQQTLNGPHDSYYQLLAVEHAHFIAGHLELEEKVFTYLEWAARNHGLDGYVPLPDKSEQNEADAARKVNLKSMVLWQAMREFNAQLPIWSGREDDLLVQIEESLPQGEERVAFVESVLPFFCRIGRFDNLKPKIPKSRVDEMAASRDVYGLSMSLPFLVSDGYVDWATDILYELAGKNGWLCTEALAVASRQVSEQARISASHEKFAYALISLLDGMAAEYWSRLHDVQLIDSFCAWLEKPVYWTEWLWRDLVRAAIRNYGLSPAFWERMSAALASEDPLFDELKQARDRFTALDSTLPAWSTAQALPLSVRENLAYFGRAGNHESARVLRELVGCRLLAAADTEAEADRLPLQEVLACSNEEMVRLAALPVASDQGLIARMPTLRQTLGGMQQEISRAGRYALQRRMGDLLRKMGTGSEIPVTEIMEVLREVENFGDAGNQFLAVDVLARVWRAAGKTAVVSALARAFAKHAQQGLQVQSEWPAQPLLAGIATFRSIQGSSGDKLLMTYLRQIEMQLEERYGSRLAQINAALNKPVAMKMKAPAGQDTLVVIYSCRAYLGSRVQAIRESWLKDLQARGIPYVVLVGDGKDELEGDLLALNVSDRYEDLPAKSLAMVRWVSMHTDFQYLLKIDDDCFLNVDEYFDSLSYRKFHYYGRILRREPGSMDRKWHQEKSQGTRAQRALDKSPEPAIYADGGGAYSLSRLAMTQIVEKAESLWGRRLTASSFMEDKLVGDLLAAGQIPVSNEDYYTLVRRRFGSDATPVCIWDNVFAPSALSPVKMAHLDTASDMVPVRAIMQGSSLWPRKIWPTYMAPSLRQNANQLELLTPLADARRLMEEPLVVVAMMRNEKIMLPHFLAHYRKLGVRAFIIGDNISDDGSRELLLAQPDVVLYSVDTAYRDSVYGVAWQQAVLANHCVGKWALVADADELLVYPDCEAVPLSELVARVGADGYDAVSINMVDMYPYGDLADADFEKSDPFEVAPWFDNPPLLPWRLVMGTYSNAANHVSALRHRQMPSSEPHAFTAQKFCLIRYSPWMRFCAGMHNVANARVAPSALAFAHFKYHAGFKKKVEEEVLRKQHFGDAQEYKKYLAMLAEGRGQFGQDELSMRYKNSSQFIDVVCRGNDS